MSDHRNSRGLLRGLYAGHRESGATLGVAMALIAMLFIVGIITAFIHAADTTKIQTARTPASPPTETTGSGSAGP